ncbi:MAG TPA: transglycosylase [Clostridiales bacterium]|nr:transglycosylase [Clostridiales bacterium]
MTNENNQKNLNNTQNGTTKKKKKKSKKRKIKYFRILLLVLLLVCAVAAVIVGKMVIDVIKDAPKINPTNVLDTLSESSVILDQQGNVIEQIHAADENREIVELSKMPKHLQDAFVAIEDKRFDKHFGVDIRRIMGALVSNLKSGDLAGQGASTITQQLVKNLYLTNEKKLERKIKEAYLSIQMERQLTKDQILENYLNTIPLGQSAYGVQAAAYAYFSKDVSELTLAESALLAAVPKSTKWYTPYRRIELTDLDGVPEEDIVGYVYIGSIQYACVYNELAVERQHVVLKEMLNQNKINQEEYDLAIKEDMRKALNPGEKKIEGITSNNFTDYVKEQVIIDLMEENDITYEEAEHYLFKGGLSIYTTMDVNIQKTIEQQYQSFGEIFLGKEPPANKPLAQDWTNFRWSDGKATGTLDKYKNVLNDSGHVLYFAHDNILNAENTLYFYPSEYKIDENGNLVITSDKLNIGSTVIDIVDCYTIDAKNQFVTHNIGGLNIGNEYEIVEQKGNKGTIKISKDYLDKNPDFYKVVADDVITISNNYYRYEEMGIVQPQSAAVILDYKTGHIKAIVGGRDIVGSKTFNRAVDSARQPGSTIKPLGVYITALDHGYTAASVFDDIPLYNKDGQRWPKNWYEPYSSYPFKYKGLVTLRYAIQQSLNTIPVTLLEQLGPKTVVEYFAKLGMVDLENPENDTFVTPEEDHAINDMNPSSLSLGGFSKGFSPLVMTAAYGTIANNGVYVEPICYTKVVNSDGKIILDNVPETHVAVAPEVAFILKDILRSSVSDAAGLARTAAIKGLDIDMAAKTGTTQDNGDFWCLGFSPYYAGGVWVGNDNPTMKLSETSTATARLLGSFMTSIHQGLEPAKFDVVDGVVKVQVCKQSGKIPTELCSLDPRGSQIITEYFIKGTEPKETCKAHVKISVCNDSNQLRSQYCPDSSIVDKVFITRETLFNPDLYPDVKNSSYQALIEAINLYRQVKEDINNGMTAEEITTMYPGLVTLKVREISNSVITNEENQGSGKKQVIEILSIHGYTIDQLSFKKMLTEDYQYQVPLDICEFHTYEKWYENMTNNGGNNGNNNGEGQNPDNPGNEDNNGDNTENPDDGIIETPDEPGNNEGDNTGDDDIITD